MLAFPIALYMAKVASPRGRRLLVIAVLMPLWASYLVKAYAWRGMFSEGGLIDWLGKPFGIQSPGYGLTATAITLAYLWLPYMILPIYAGLERLPDSLLEASATSARGRFTTLRAGSCCRWRSRPWSPARIPRRNGTGRRSRRRVSRSSCARSSLP